MRSRIKEEEENQPIHEALGGPTHSSGKDSGGWVKDKVGLIYYRGCQGEEETGSSAATALAFLVATLASAM